MSVHHMHIWYPRRPEDPLEMEFWMAKISCMCSGNWRSINLQAISPVLDLLHHVQATFFFHGSFLPSPNTQLGVRGHNYLFQRHLGIDTWKTKNKFIHRQSTARVFVICLHRLTLWLASSSPCLLLSGLESTYILVKPAPRSVMHWPPFWAFISLCFALAGEYEPHKF